MTCRDENEHFLYPGRLYVKRGQCHVTTILGSCVSVCLWDPKLKAGGINHYMLPLWNGEGLPSPKYGNIAIEKLVSRMLELGSRKEELMAKVFGGGAVLNNSSGINVGERNSIIAEDILKNEGIPIIGKSLGGEFGRKIIFNTASGEVLMKKVHKIGDRTVTGDRR